MKSGFKFQEPASLDLSIIIVSFNTRDILLGCIDSIRQRTQGITYEIIVVDNASDDNTSEIILKNFPDISFILNKDNRGFSAANNQGILESKGRIIAFLNPDTLLLENSFEKMVHYLDAHPDYSILGPGILNEKNQQSPTRLWEDTPRDASLKILGFYDPNSELERMGELKPKEVMVISGCCFVVQRKLIESIGLMDENYFLYNEEDDFCRRARRKGMKICFYPETSIRHLSGKSTHQAKYRERVVCETYRSDLYFYSKYYSRMWNLILRILYKLAFAVGLVRSAIRHMRGSATSDDSIRLKLRLLLMISS